MNKKSLAFKLYTSIALLLLISFCGALYAVMMLNKTQSYAEGTGNIWLPSVDSLHRVNHDIAYINKLEYSMVAQKNGDERKKTIDEVQAAYSQAEKDLQRYATFITEPEEKSKMTVWNKSFNDYKESGKKVLASVNDGKVDDAFDTLMKTSETSYKEMTNVAEDLIQLNNKGAVDSTKKGSAISQMTNIIMGLMMALSLVVSFFVVKVIRGSTHSIHTAVTHLQEQSIENNKIAETLKKNADILSKSAEEESTSVQKTAIAIDEIFQMLNKNSLNLKESERVVKTVADKTEEGQKTMQRLVAAMETIHDSNNQLQDIANIINQINSKTAVINDIVSKTELLSLNASIESARAGEYGKGFAVVAEEVGNLAKISGKSAHEIQSLIDTSQERVNQILEVTTSRVAEGKKVTIEAQSSFEGISKEILSMSTVMTQISQATKEQEAGTKQISNAIEHIGNLSQNSQKGVQAIATSSGDLVNQSQKLDLTAKTIDELILGSTNDLPHS